MKLVKGSWCAGIPSSLCSHTKAQHCQHKVRKTLRQHSLNWVKCQLCHLWSDLWQLSHLLGEPQLPHLKPGEPLHCMSIFNEAIAITFTWAMFSGLTFCLLWAPAVCLGPLGLGNKGQHNIPLKTCHFSIRTVLNRKQLGKRTRKALCLLICPKC